VYAISQKDLAFFAQRFPQISRNIYRFLILQLRSLMQAFQSHTVLNTTGRLACRILHFSYLGSRERFQNEIELPISQAELASALGVSRGHLNRALFQLQQAGLIQIQGQKLTILDRRGLLQLTEGIFTE
jgi:CRP-like cAMP-binding protein